MEAQTYHTHVHRPRLTGLGYLFVSIALVGFALRWFHVGGRWTFALGLAGLTAAVVVLLVISRRYTTRLQDRIIKLEMRVRCSTLLSPAQQRMFASLTNKQIAALRFASDAELPGLLERAAGESMKPDDIKRAVRTWTPDHDRT